MHSTRQESAHYSMNKASATTEQDAIFCMDNRPPEKNWMVFRC